MKNIETTTPRQCEAPDEATTERRARRLARQADIVIKSGGNSLFPESLVIREEIFAAALATFDTPDSTLTK